MIDALGASGRARIAHGMLAEIQGEMYALEKARLTLDQPREAPMKPGGMTYAEKEEELGISLDRLLAALEPDVRVALGLPQAVAPDS